MCPYSLFKVFAISLVLFVVMGNRQRHVDASSPNTRQMENNHLRNNRGRFSPRVAPQAQFSRLRPEPFTDFLGDDEELIDMIKRQSDDYGHMRFGKREFDDYGHMRFGKSVPEK